MGLLGAEVKRRGGAGRARALLAAGAALAACVALGGCGGRVAAAPGTASAPASIRGGNVSDEIEQLMRAQGARLWRDDVEAARAVEFGAAGRPFAGLVVAVPEGLSGPGPLSVAVLTQQTSARAWQVPAAKNLVLAIGEAESGRVAFVPVVDDPKAREFGLPPGTRRPPPPDPEEADDLTTKLWRVEIAPPFAGPPPGGALAVAALAGDWLSNVARTTLPQAAPPPRAAVARPGDKRRRIDAVPDYARSGLVPPPPARGLAFRFRFDPRRPGVPLVEGSFTKPVTASERVPPGEGVGLAGAAGRTAAVVRVVLAAFAPDSPQPWVQEFGVPVAAEGEVETGGPVTGHFRLEFVDAKGAPPEPGRWLVYGFVGGEPSGPVAVEIGSP